MSLALKRKTTIDERMELSQAHEAAVAGRLREFGWAVEPYGQELLTPEARRILRNTSSPHRWLPDMLASKYNVTLMVDAKTAFPGQPCHSFEKSSLSSLAQHERTAVMPVVVVFSNWTVARISTMQIMTGDTTVCKTGIPKYGSDTNFWLFEKHAVTRKFDDVFKDTSSVIFRLWPEWK